MYYTEELDLLFSRKQIHAQTQIDVNCNVYLILIKAGVNCLLLVSLKRAQTHAYTHQNL